MSWSERVFCRRWWHRNYPQRSQALESSSQNGRVARLSHGDRGNCYTLCSRCGVLERYPNMGETRYKRNNETNVFLPVSLLKLRSTKLRLASRVTSCGMDPAQAECAESGKQGDQIVACHRGGLISTNPARGSAGKSTYYPVAQKLCVDDFMCCWRWYADPKQLTPLTSQVNVVVHDQTCGGIRQGGDSHDVRKRPHDTIEGGVCLTTFKVRLYSPLV